MSRLRDVRAVQRIRSVVGVLAGELLAEQRVREELQRRDVAKTEFVALASHELRTPISAVYGILATLHTKGSSLREQQLVELRATAFGQAERLRTLADQLLDLSQLDADSVKLNPQATGVVPLRPNRRELPARPHH